jgi:hypothetical protein
LWRRLSNKVLGPKRANFQKVWLWFDVALFIMRCWRKFSLFGSDFLDRRTLEIYQTDDR